MAYGHELNGSRLDMFDIISNIEEYADHSNPATQLEEKELQEQELSQKDLWDRLEQILPQEIIELINSKIEDQARDKSKEYLRRLSAFIADSGDIKKRALYATFIPYCINPQIIGAPSLQNLANQFGYTSRANVSRELLRFSDATGLTASTSKTQEQRIQRRRINNKKKNK